MRIKKLLVMVMLLSVMTACGSSKKEIGLNSIQNGIVLYYDDSDASARLSEALEELSVTDGFDLVKVNVGEQNGVLASYEDKNKKVIETYRQVLMMEAKLSQLKPGSASANSASLQNGILLNYRKALNLVKTGKLSAEGEKELSRLIREIEPKQELKENEIRKLLELQKDARLQIPVYSSVDGDADPVKLPVMKVIYEGNVRTSFAFGQKPIPSDILSSKEQLGYYLKEKAWISNFQDSGDGDAIKGKLDNKETFVLLLWGNSCPHCHKVMPILDKLSDQTGVKAERLDTFLEANNRAYSKLVASGKYGLADIKWVPTLVYIKDGKQASTIGAYDYAVENPEADLGYDVDEAKLMEFLEQAK